MAFNLLGRAWDWAAASCAAYIEQNRVNHEHGRAFETIVEELDAGRHHITGIDRLAQPGFPQLPVFISHFGDIIAEHIVRHNATKGLQQWLAVTHDPNQMVTTRHKRQDETVRLPLLSYATIQDYSHNDQSILRILLDQPGIDPTRVSTERTSASDGQRFMTPFDYAARYRGSFTSALEMIAEKVAQQARQVAQGMKKEAA
jgi:hypothetical protein